MGLLLVGIPGGADANAYIGFLFGVFPIAVASYEFGKRILIHRACRNCRGSGLIVVG